jgi:hypothetical protein
VTTIGFCAIAGTLLFRAVPAGFPCIFLEAAFLTLAWFWLLSPTQNPWYWIWALPLLPFARGRAWFAVSGLVFIYYLRFWLLYHWPAQGILGTRYNGPLFFDFVMTWIEFGPWLLWLGATALGRRVHTSQSGDLPHGGVWSSSQSGGAWYDRLWNVVSR